MSLEPDSAEVTPTTPYQKILVANLNVLHKPNWEQVALQLEMIDFNKIRSPVDISDRYPKSIHPFTGK